MNIFLYVAQTVNANALPKTNANIIPNVISLIFAVFGAIAVVVVIYAGIQLILSQGNSEKVAQAKRSITYAIVGLIVISLAQVIVMFINGAITK